MDLGLNIVDGVRGLDLKGDGLARKGLDEAINISLVSYHLNSCIDVANNSEKSYNLMVGGGWDIGISYICTKIANKVSNYSQTF